MISKIEFENRFRDFLEDYELSLGQASAILRISKLRAYLYRSGWFKFDQERETEVINRMANYILLQKLRRAWRERTEISER
jgi:hypothetical protein